MIELIGFSHIVLDAKLLDDRTNLLGHIIERAVLSVPTVIGDRFRIGWECL